MSIQALNWVLERDEITNSGAKFVLMILCNYANEKGECYPSWETIANKTSTSRQSVYRHLEWLESNGYIKPLTRRHKGKQSSNLYQIQFEVQSNKLDVSQGNKLDTNEDYRVTICEVQSNKLDVSQGNNLLPKPKASKDEPKEENQECVNSHTHTRDESALDEFSSRCLQFVQTQKNTLTGLAKIHEWQFVCNSAFDAQISAEDFETCYLLLEKEKILKNGRWKITPQMMSDNLLNLQNLQNEITALSQTGIEKNGNKPSYQSAHERREQAKLAELEFTNKLNLEVKERNRFLRDASRGSGYP